MVFWCYFFCFARGEDGALFPPNQIHAIGGALVLGHCPADVCVSMGGTGGIGDLVKPLPITPPQNGRSPKLGPPLFFP